MLIEMFGKLLSLHFGMYLLLKVKSKRKKRADIENGYD